MWKWQITHPEILDQPHTERYNDQRRSNFSIEMDWVTLNRGVGRHPPLIIGKRRSGGTRGRRKYREVRAAQRSLSLQCTFVAKDLGGAAVPGEKTPIFKMQISFVLPDPVVQVKLLVVVCMCVCVCLFVFFSGNECIESLSALSLKDDVEINRYTLAVFSKTGKNNMTQLFLLQELKHTDVLHHRHACVALHNSCSCCYKGVVDRETSSMLTFLRKRAPFSKP